MKIGVMTYWWSNDNYGQLLQCYALQKYLRDAGHDAYLIRYDMSNDYPSLSLSSKIRKKMLNAINPIKLYKHVLYRIQAKERIAAIADEETKNKARNFDGFRSKHIKQSEMLYYFYDELKENPPKADVYIVGSDQIWNPDFLSSSWAKAYFLDFGEASVKRTSYAASFGKEELDDDFVKTITPLLQKFDYVSVREKSGLDICKQCGVNGAEWVPDPTILLEADLYRALYKDESFEKPTRPYVFFYFLGNGSDFSVDSVYDWAKSKNLEVIYVSANQQFDKHDKTYATIPQWLYLLEHAEYVITNSFHCCVFSLIFQKKFGVASLSKKNVGMNTRMNSLFELFQIKERWLFSEFSVLDNEIDWLSVSKIFQSLRKNSKLSHIVGERKK
jgi:hypothetical protein